MVLLEVPEGTVEIQDWAYMDRTDITVVRIPASVKAIRYGAFAGCSGITTLHLPESVRSIGEGAFDSCTGIASLRIPHRVQSIGNYAFARCSDIADLDLPEGLQSIGDCAFLTCTGLETLVLPASLTSTGGGHYGAFEGCTRLARVLAPDTLAKGDMADPAQVFEDCPALDTGLTPLSAVKPPRRRFWHPTMHAWCTAAGRACVLAVLVAELRVDQQEDPRFPSLPHELWLLILEFAPRRELGAPPLTSV